MNRSLNLFGTQDSRYSTSVKISLHFLDFPVSIRNRVLITCQICEVWMVRVMSPVDIAYKYAKPLGL